MPYAQEIRRMPYMPQLDALRCFAAIIVVFQHTAGPRILRFGLSGVGIYGVWFFFVLSGFLITGILLREAIPEAVPIGAALRAFYLRRFLRIFPAYYLVLTVGIALAIGSSFRADWPWHVAYLSNWLMAWRGKWADAAGPLWSLGVEEQFYLLWPAIVLLAPRKRLPAIFIAVAALGVASRILVVLAAPNHGAPATIVTPTTSNLDPLALGALLAWAHTCGAKRAAVLRLTRWSFAAGASLLAFVALSTADVIDRGWSLLPIIETLGASLVSVCIIDRAAVGVKSNTLAGRLLDARALRYLGGISYGIYLWHSVVLTVLLEHMPATARAYVALPLGSVAFFVVVTALSVVIASLSWTLYERPINSLKARVPYPKPSTRSDETGAIVVPDGGAIA